MPERPLVLISDFLTDSTVEAEVLEGLADVALAGAHAEADLDSWLPRADAWIMYHDLPMVTDRAFALAGRCRGIVRAGVGFNNIDILAASARGLLVCNVPDYGTEEVADHAIMLLLAVARRLVPTAVSIRDGAWDVAVAHGSPRLRGKTLGLVGCGRIGTATALRAKAFGLDVVFYDPYVPPGLDKALGIRRAATLDQLLPQCQFLSLHCYLEPATHHLIDAETLAQLPAGALLINTARGPIVDQAALLSALESGHLGGAGLDVVEREPLDDDALRRHPKVILTPHSAFYSVEGFVELRRKAAEEAARLLRGEPPRCPVNRPATVAPRK